MKSRIALMITGMLALAAVWAAVAWSEGQPGPDSAISRMDTSAFERTRRPAAVFDHDAHNETAGLEDCAACHHVWEEGRLVEGESSEDSPCSECHGLTRTRENPMALVNAFHTQCRTCHMDAGKGPLLCGQCHRKIQGGE